MRSVSDARGKMEKILNKEVFVILRTHFVLRSCYISRLIQTKMFTCRHSLTFIIFTDGRRVSSRLAAITTIVSRTPVVYLPPESMTPVMHLEIANIFTNFQRKIEIALMEFGGPGEDDS